VTAANVAEVTVGLEAVDRVKVPQPQSRPGRAQSAWPLTKATTVPTSGGSFAEEGFSRPFQGGVGNTAASQVDLWCIQLARVGGT
jgi:hypothetical protein